jgi:uncharacterized repeat protein (TIGR01451 family)
MKKLHITLCAAAGALLCASTALAAPTGAGVTIRNQAIAQYTVDTKQYVVNSPEITFQVAQIVNVSVVSRDVATVPVSASDTNKVTTFRVTNEGNGPDEFIFSAEGVNGNNFLPLVSSYVIDKNGDGVNDAGDMPYPSGSKYLLAPGEGVTVFVLNNIPANVVANDIGKTQFKAQSAAFNSGAAGTVYPRFGVDKVDVVLGLQDGAATDLGTYKVTGVTVTLNKSSVITDPWGGNKPVPGATVTYTIMAQIVGDGTANDLKIVDPVPANTTYKFGSLKLNGASLTDGMDLDAGDASPDTITFTLGNVPGGSPNQTVSFQVIID